MEKLRRILTIMRTREWQVPSHRVILGLMLLVAVVMRFPYFFMTNDIRMWRYEMLYHDEALFIMHGRDVLAGKLPYIGHWDNRPPFGWFLFGIFNFLSGENLVAFRAIGALYIGLTSFVLYRTLADRQKVLAGILAGIFYAIFCSVAQISQSITYEHVVALPFCLMMYLLVNPRPTKWHRMYICLLFAVCVMTLTNFILLGPAMAMLLPGRPGKNDMAAPPPFGDTREWVRGMVRWAGFVVRNGLTLLAVVLACYSVLYTVYWINDQHRFLVRSLVDGAFTVSRQPMDGRLVTQVWGRWQGFSNRFLNSYVYSNEWLIPFMLTVFFCRCASTLFEKRGKRDVVLLQIMSLMVFGAFALFFRGGNFWNFPYYLLQMMPLVALAMGCAVAFRMGDGRLLMMLVIIGGLGDATRMVLSQYRPLIEYAEGNNKFSASFMNDRIYQVANALSIFPMAGNNLIVCNEDDMLYVLTHAENPRYFIFPSFNNYFYLARVLGVVIEPLEKTVKDSKPVAIVGWKGDSCFSSIGDTLKTDYSFYSLVQNMTIYVRKDILDQIRGNPPAPFSQAP